MDVLCVGLIVCDIIVRPVNTDLFSNDVTLIDKPKIIAGGDALNVANTLARMGTKVGLVGRIGNDVLGKEVIETTLNSNIINHIIIDKEASTSTSIVLVEENGERHFAYYGDSNNNLCSSDINIELLKKVKHLHIGSAFLLDKLDNGGTCELFKLAKENDISTSLDVTHDPKGLWLKTIGDALFYTDIFMPSIYEAQAMTGCEEIKDIVFALSKYNIKVLVIKLGEKGCYITDFKNEYNITAFESMPVIDTTGAGDCFVAAFISSYLDGSDLKTCGVIGNAAAAHCIGNIGADPNFKNKKQITDFLTDRGVNIE